MSYRSLQQQLLFWHLCALVLGISKFYLMGESSLLTLFYPAIFLVLAGLGKLLGEGIRLTIWMWLFDCLSTCFLADFLSRFGKGFDCGRAIFVRFSKTKSFRATVELINDTRLVGSHGKSRNCGYVSSSCQIMQGSDRGTVIWLFQVECVYLCKF